MRAGPNGTGILWIAVFVVYMQSGRKKKNIKFQTTGGSVALWTQRATPQLTDTTEHNWFSWSNEYRKIYLIKSVDTIRGDRFVIELNRAYHTKRFEVEKSEK